MKLRKQFNENDKKETGGVTGSARVSNNEDGNFYQLKPSILDNPSIIRRKKVHSKDRENFGEVIASSIGRALLGDGAVPQVFLVYDPDKKRVLIASKYLEGDVGGVRDLDAYAREQRFTVNKHIEIIPGSESDRALGKMAIDGDDPVIDKKSLAEAVVLSAILGDHDVNPGNMIVVTNDGISTVCRIDFGHAFNDLLRAFKLFGGRVRDENHIMDFFNRENVAGINSPSKLWRDLSGIIPSQELATALEKLGNTPPERVDDAVELVKLEFKTLYNTMLDNKDKDGCDHVIDSLLEIYKSFSGRPFVSTGNTGKDVNLVFASLAAYIKTNIENTLNASRIMQLQVDISRELKAGVSVETIIERYSANFINAFSTVNEFESVKWIKDNKELPPFEGTFSGYVLRKQLELNNEAQQKMPYSTISTQIAEFIADYKKRPFQGATGSYKSFLIENGLQEVLVQLNKGDVEAASLATAKLQNDLLEQFGDKKSLGRKSKAFSEVELIQKGLESIIKRNSQIVSPLSSEDLPPMRVSDPLPRGNHPMKDRLRNTIPPVAAHDTLIDDERVESNVGLGRLE